MPTAREHLTNVSGDIQLARTVMAGMSTFLDRLPSIFQAVRDEVIANGATVEETQPISDASDLLESEANALLAKMATLPNGQPAPVGNPTNPTG